MKKTLLALLVCCGARTELRGTLQIADADADTSSDAADSGKDSQPPSPCVATEPTLLASGGKEIQFIALDHDDVYWTDFARGEVAAVPKAGGAVRVIAPGRDNPSGLVVVGPTLYWTEFGAGDVMSGAAAGGGQFTTIASKQDGAFDVAAASDAIYWTTVQSCSVARADDDGGKFHVLVHAKQPFTAITSTSDHVFWVSIEDKIIARYDVGSGNVSTLLSVDALDLPSTLATDGKNVYFGGTSPNELVVSAIPIVGGDPVALFSEDCSDSGATRCIGDVATDGEFVYFTSKTGDVRKVSTSGGQPTTIATGQARPFAVTVDDRCVYWSNLIDGTVWAAPKK